MLLLSLPCRERCRWRWRQQKRAMSCDASVVASGAPAPVVAAESDVDGEWAGLAEQTMDHDFASRCLDEREVVRRAHLALSSGGAEDGAAAVVDCRGCDCCWHCEFVGGARLPLWGSNP